jgi:hypothetical protein
MTSTRYPTARFCFEVAHRNAASFGRERRRKWGSLAHLRCVGAGSSTRFLSAETGPLQQVENFAVLVLVRKGGFCHIMTVMLSQLDKGAMISGRPEEQLPVEQRKRR